MKAVIWTITDLVRLLKARQQNEFDGNTAVSGDRGNGKSILLTKIFYRFKIFKPLKHQVYKREDIIELLRNYTYSVVFDDEAVNSSYKRDFQNKGQQEYIKILTAYRDSFNILGSAIPSFFSLDKDLRDLFFLHLHVIERGIAVVHMPLQGRLYSLDRWDAKNNAKVEEKWGKRMAKNPNYKPAYHQLTTFRGYLYFKDATEKQKKLYKEIKKEKRAKDIGAKTEIKKDFFTKVFELLKENKLTSQGLKQMCLYEGKKYTIVRNNLREKLENAGDKVTLKEYLAETLEEAKKESAVRDLVPDFQNN